MIRKQQKMKVIDKIDKQLKDRIKIQELKYNFDEWCWIAHTQKIYIETNGNRRFENRFNKKLNLPTKKNLKLTMKKINNIENKIRKIIKKWENEPKWRFEYIVDNPYYDEVNEFFEVLKERDKKCMK